ncbi:MAG TPA: DNA primase [candidate division WWE3 bacterium]|uniref:DNA primase n=1 Tax=candidate division WWE3 bacterium TaxID=2053526 RepID=A0A7V5J188_UNCKA|nr:DNA primase [candidate division WWE3 bacterium]
MTTQDAKKIDLVDVMARLGHTPTKIQGASVWYRSPFREEKTASFKVNKDLNSWYDFGIGEGGRIIELFQALYNDQSVPHALEIIGNMHAFSVPTPAPLPKPPKQKTDKPVITAVREISNPALIQYLEQKRGLDPELVRLYASEIHYNVGNASYIAIGHANEKGGFDVRNGNFKGCLKAKDITHFTGTEKTGKIAVFEGLFDFLALLQMHKLKEPPHDALILNSVSLVDRACEYIEEQEFNDINLYLDNDKAGEQAIETFRKNFKIVKDHSKKYLKYKDLNDLLLDKNAFLIELKKAKSKNLNP